MMMSISWNHTFTDLSCYCIFFILLLFFIAASGTAQAASGDPVIGCWEYYKQNPIPYLKFNADGTLLDYYKGQLWTSGSWTKSGSNEYDCTLRNTDTGGTTYFTLVLSSANSMYGKYDQSPNPLSSISCNAVPGIQVITTITTTPIPTYTTAIPTYTNPVQYTITPTISPSFTGSESTGTIIIIGIILILGFIGVIGFILIRKVSPSPVKEQVISTPMTASPTSPPTSQNAVSPFTLKPQTPKQLPQELSDRYTESEFIGKGGFARVFKAKRKDGKYVAVKIPISLDASTGKSFIAEMQNWTKLEHSNIVRVYDYNIMPMPYFEMELCDESLAEMKKPVECEEAAWLIFNVCEGLKFTHSRSIIHRDLKPQNILLKNGIPKISDWGLSKVVSESTSTTATSFTPYYAAPEQINSKHKDERTDIWQLGVILYELCTGMLPFRGDSVVEIAVNISTKDPQRPSEIVPAAQPIESVLMKCLEKEPSKRYQTVLELQKDLAIYLRKNYTELLKTSVTIQDYNQSAYYCGDLVMINLLIGDIPTAYKYLLDLVRYSKGDVNDRARELSEQIQMRMDMGLMEVPEELIQKAEIIVHQVSVDSRKK